MNYDDKVKPGVNEIMCGTVASRRYFSAFSYCNRNHVKAIVRIHLHPDITLHQDFDKFVDSITHHHRPELKYFLWKSLVREFFRGIGLVYTPYPFSLKNYLKILKGLPNVGQSCYINAVIITLFHIKELREYILNLSVDDKDTFIFYLQCIFKRLEMEDNIRRSDFCTLIQVFRSHCGPFTRIMQEDAYQFLLFVLSRVQQHICAEQNISPGIISNTIITDLFRGLQKDVSICQNCKLTVSNNQLFYSLSLTSNSKTITITELLMENSRDIYVSQNFRCYYCDNTQCTLKSSIHQWPRYLIISLSKLKQGFMRKLFKNAWKLTVPKLQFVAPQSSDSQGQSGSEQTAAKKEGEVDQGKEVRYDLKAVIDHKGTAYHGHYKATVLTADWDWIEFDDAKVNIRNSNDVISRINYILLFKREDSQDVPSILSK